MKPEGSLPHSQEPTTCPYPEPDRNIPCPHPTSLRSILILPSHLRLDLPNGLFPVYFVSLSPYPVVDYYTYTFLQFSRSWTIMVTLHREASCVISGFRRRIHVTSCRFVAKYGRLGTMYWSHF